MPKHVFDKSWEPAETHYVEIIVLCLKNPENSHPSRAARSHPGWPKAPSSRNERLCSQPKVKKHGVFCKIPIRHFRHCLPHFYGTYGTCCYIFIRGCYDVPLWTCHSLTNVPCSIVREQPPIPGGRKPPRGTEGPQLVRALGVWCGLWRHIVVGRKEYISL